MSRDLNISEKTSIPLGWVMSGFIGLSGIIAIGAMWTSRVDFRLQRIEERLDIPAYHSQGDWDLVPNSKAASSHNWNWREHSK